MHELKRVLAESYYTIIFLLATQLWCVFIAWRNRNKFSELRFFHWYPTSALIQSILVFGAMIIIPSFSNRVIDESISIFLVMEFLLIYSVAYRTIVMKWDRLFLKALFVIYVIYFLSMWVFTNAIEEYYQVYLIQATVVLIPSALYFFEIFKEPTGESLTIQPAFWINLGILFLFSSNIPLFILENYARNFISQNTYLWAIGYVAYGIFFLLITKAYTCKPTTRLDYSLL